MFSRTELRLFPGCMEAFTIPIHGYIMNPIIQAMIFVSVFSLLAQDNSSGRTKVVHILIISYAKVNTYTSKKS